MKKILLLVLMFFSVIEISESSIFVNSFRSIASCEYAAGMAEANSGNYARAFHLLEVGWLRSGDPRFLSALAGVSYKMKRPDRAKQYLLEVLEARPNDPYSNRFIGTLFLMEGNMEAALKYLNRIDEPKIVNIKLEAAPEVDSVVMDKALVFSPASALLRDEFLETESRLRQMGIFKRTDFRLQPREDGQAFDLIVRPYTKKGMLGSKLKIATALIQAVFTQTVRPEFHNIRGTTISSTSLISWDEYRHRLHSSISFPYGNNPHARIRLFGDARRETWDLAADLDFRKWEAGLELSESQNSWLNWSGGAKLSYRQFDTLTIDEPEVFRTAWMVHLFAATDLSLLRIPEKRFTIRSRSQAGTALSPAGSFEGSISLQHSFDMKWYPNAVGEDYAMTARVGAGTVMGNPTFDQFFVLGVERDTDLILRSHRSNLDKKGGNPFTSRYLLLNWDVSKNVMKRRLVWDLVPFVDAAVIADNPFWNHQRWFVDAGMQSSFRFLGSPELVFTYGKDLRTGRNVFYVALSP